MADEEQSELQMRIESIRARVSEFQQSSQPPSSADFADVMEDVTRALTSVYAELKNLRSK